MLRTPQLVGFMVLATVAQAQDLVKPCNYTTRAVPLHIALEDLSKSTGIHLECSPELDLEPIILRFKDVSVKVAMDKIAYVFAGEWKKIDGRYRLVEGRAADDLHAQNLKQYADDFRAGVNEASKKHFVDQPYTSAQATKTVNEYVAAAKQRNGMAVAETRTGSPAGHLLIRILQRMHGEDVVNAPAGRKLVYSSSPNQLQGSLPDIHDLMDQFVREQPVMNRVVDSATPEEQDWTRDILNGDVSIPIRKVVVSLDGYRGRYLAAIWVLGPTGQLIARSTAEIAGKHSTRANVERLNEDKKKFKDGVSFGPIALDILPAMNSQEYYHRPSPTTKNALLNPTIYEPSSNATSDIVLGLAERDKVNVAFLAPDSCEFWTLHGNPSGKATLASFEASQEFMHEIAISEDDKWLIGKPFDPLDVQMRRLSRPALEKFLKAVDEKKDIKMDDECTFAFDASPYVDFSQAEVAVRDLFDADFPDDNQNIACMAFVGSITPTQKKNSVDGVLNLPVSDLFDEQKQLLLQWSVTDQPFFPVNVPPNFNGIQSDYDNNPTEVLGNGFPSDAYVEIDDVTDYTFSLRRKSYQGKWGIGGVTVDRLSLMQAQSERSDLFPDSTDYELGTVRLETDRNVVIKFVVSGLRQVQQFAERGKTLKDEVAFDKAFDFLPARVRIEYAQALEKHRDEIRVAHPG